MSNIEGYGCASIRPLSLEEINERKSAVYRKDLTEPFHRIPLEETLGTSVEEIPRGRLEYNENNFQDVDEEKGPMDFPYKTIGQPQYDEPYNPNEKLYSPEIAPNKPEPHSLPAYILNQQMEKESNGKNNYFFWIILFIIVALLVWALTKK